MKHGEKVLEYLLLKSKFVYQATPNMTKWQRNERFQRIICKLIKLAAEHRGISSFLSLSTLEFVCKGKYQGIFESSISKF